MPLPGPGGFLISFHSLIHVYDFRLAVEMVGSEPKCALVSAGLQLGHSAGKARQAREGFAHSAFPQRKRKSCGRHSLPVLHGGCWGWVRRGRP